jgi:hypothetical protein
VNREAELEPPSRVACSDLLGVISVNKISEYKSHTKQNENQRTDDDNRADDSALPASETHPCGGQLPIWSATNYLDESDAKIHERDTQWNHLKRIDGRVTKHRANKKKQPKHQSKANRSNPDFNPCAPAKSCIGGGCVNSVMKPNVQS